MEDKVFRLIIFFLFLPLNGNEINQTEMHWHEMQELYRSCKENMQEHEGRISWWSHNRWKWFRSEIAKTLESEDALTFFKEPCFYGPMIRREYDMPQIFEETFLESCISQYTKNIIAKITDTDFGGFERSSKKFNCSTTTLGHLFYLAKILEQISQSTSRELAIETIVEFGGGYGNLARLIKQALPESTIVMIDFPELCALQWFFLKNTAQNSTVVFHRTLPLEIVPKAINLIPLHLLDSIFFKTDLFISTFGLSECPQHLQENIIEKRFFDARYCYIVGQLDGWGRQFNFVSHKNILESITKLYSNVICQPFHIVTQELKSYEVFANNIIKVPEKCVRGDH